MDTAQQKTFVRATLANAVAKEITGKMLSEKIKMSVLFLILIVENLT
jgi:hypothetical protein